MPTPQREPLRPITVAERDALQRIVSTSSERVDQVRRATAVLAVAHGRPFIQAAGLAGLRSGTTVADLVARFNRHGLAALEIAIGRGRKPTYTPRARARIVATAQRSPKRRTDGTAESSLATGGSTPGTDGTPGAARIRAAFEQARADGRIALIPYVVAGYPDQQTSLQAALAAIDAGADLLLVSSADGVNWSAPVRIATGPATVNTYYALPGLAANPSRPQQLAMAYYRLRGEAIDAYFVSSNDDGAHWSAPRRLSPQSMSRSWMPDTQYGPMLADYISTSYVNGRPIPIVVLAGRPRGAQLQQSVFAALVR